VRSARRTRGSELLFENLALEVGRKPPGGLNLFRQAVLGDAPGACAAGYELCVLFITGNDALRGSGDVVP